MSNNVIIKKVYLTELKLTKEINMQILSIKKKLRDKHYKKIEDEKKRNLLMSLKSNMETNNDRVLELWGLKNKKSKR
jgi:hypothetical protein